jgi:hypothetical protein
MKITVPTLWVEALLTSSLEVAGNKFAAGEIVKIPYGVALQAHVIGTVATIKDADKMHVEATMMLQKFGPDSWFPQSIQTCAKISEWLSEVAAQNAPSTPTKH